MKTGTNTKIKEVAIRSISSIIIAVIAYYFETIFKDDPVISKIYLIAYCISFIVAGFGVIKKGIENAMLKANVTEEAIISIASFTCLGFKKYCVACIIMAIFQLVYVVNHAIIEKNNIETKTNKLYVSCYIVTALLVLGTAIIPGLLSFGGVGEVSSMWIYKTVSIMMVGSPSYLLIAHNDKVGAVSGMIIKTLTQCAIIVYTTEYAPYLATVVNIIVLVIVLRKYLLIKNKNS